VGRSGGRTPRPPWNFTKRTNINCQQMGATWQPLIGPRGTMPFARSLPRVAFRFARCQPIKYCHITRCQVSMYGRSVSTVRPCHVAVRPAQSASFFFACLARRTDLDNFSIRTPFAKINIPPESGERDGRNGTIFVAFRAL
jgi:hypothetical protein